MGALELSGVSKSYGETVGIKDVTLSIDESEFFVILGPSGAGKTTTLKSVAGLVNIDAGVVSIAGRDMTGVEPYNRNVAMAFENYALYPQKTVGQNLASPLRSGRTGTYDQKEQDRRIEEVTATLGISELRDRFPRELSNGQRQRTVLGRVLVRPADAYLLDEPLSHLDAKLRAAMRSELKMLAEMTNTTTLYVTHDYQEALALGDRVAVLREGELVQVGTPMQLWHEPVDTFVAKTLGQPEINLLDASVEDGRIRAAGGALDVPVPADLDLGSHRALRVGIRPRDLEIVRPGRGGDGWLRVDGRVRLSERLGRSVELDVAIGDGVNLIAVDAAGGAVHEGDALQLQVYLDHVLVFAGGSDGEETSRLGALASPRSGETAPKPMTSAEETQ